MLGDRDARRACCAGRELRARRSRADERPDDPEEFYDHQLVGLRGPSRSDGEPLGAVTEVAAPAGARTCCVLDARRVARCWCRSCAEIVPVVDLAAGRVEIADRPGLLEETDAPTTRAEPMRIDVVSIFPDYLAPLDLSLLGGPAAAGLLDAAHPRPARLDAATGTARSTTRRTAAGLAWSCGRSRGATLSTPCWPPPQPATKPTALADTRGARRRREAASTQPTAERLAARPWLVFACGRYEGIDQRVVDHFADRVDVLEVSIGDYVLSGGEVAGLVVIEAVTRLLPGVRGQSPVARGGVPVVSTGTGLLEYPVYTKPPTWRGLDVPAVLLSGDHGKVDAWRQRESLRRTAQRRPDLVHPSRALVVDGLGEAELRLAQPADAGELLTLQRCCWVSEAQLNDALFVGALVETLDDVRASLDVWTTFVVRAGGRLVASVRGRLVEPRTWLIGRLMVAPDLAGRGLGRALLHHVEVAAPQEAESFRLFTGERSERNLRIYRKAGYRLLGPAPVEEERGAVVLIKRVSRSI